jgi:voltage-gated potassium channel
VAKGEVVTRRGEQAHAMYFIVSGEVEVEIKAGDHPRLGPGDFFGEVAILTDNTRTATVRACTETKLLVLLSHDLELLMGRVPEIGERIRAVAEARAPGRVTPAGR